MKNVCVYCGSSPGTNPDYLATAEKLGKLLAEGDIGLVYGGSNIGIMGALADAVLAAGGKVTGVMPKFLVQKEVAHHKLTALHVVDSMHARKLLMADLADCFVALPGGLGTLEEFFESLTWSQLGLHKKPCGLLNVRGYYDGLLSFLDHAVSEGFLAPMHRSMVLFSADPEALLKALARYKPPDVGKWLNKAKT